MTFGTWGDIGSSSMFTVQVLADVGCTVIRIGQGR
jgi:hypothetical protein